MAMNQFREQDENGAKNFGKISVEEQRKISREKLREEEQLEATNEELAKIAAQNLDQERASNIT
jgi:hypothetical protein